ncbi:MAG: 3'-5' exonuclease, partial [Ktedonobacterales bacterium]
VSRRGRGSSLQSGPRRLVWEVFQAYQAYLSSDHAHPWDRWLRTDHSDEIDFDDYARLAFKRLTSGTNPAETVPVVVPDRYCVDHLLVDESQDFDAAQLLLLVRSARRTVTLVADEAQKIYRTPSVFESLGLAFDVRANKNVKLLRLSFRTTRQIFDLARPLILDERDPTEAAQPQCDGLVPRLHVLQDASKEESHAVWLAVEEWRGCDTGVVALLVRSWEAADRLETLLKAQDVPVERIVREQGSALTPGIKLTTLHSAKGLEFDSVILFQVTEGVLPANPAEYHVEMQHDDEAEFLASERRLLYVGMTRARHTLHMTCTEPRSRFLREPYATAYETVGEAVPANVPAEATEAEEMINLDEFDDIPF